MYRILTLMQFLYLDSVDLNGDDRFFLFADSSVGIGNNLFDFSNSTSQFCLYYVLINI